MRHWLYLLLMMLLAVACSPKPQPIDYGSDSCDFCRMTIVDQQHAAELVTAKGRVYKFDAIECMMDYVQEQEAVDFAFYLVNDYLNPGQLLDANGCTFLISPNIPSPMGAFLSAFERAEEAAQVHQEKEGQLYSWEELKTHLKSK